MRRFGFKLIVNAIFPLILSGVLVVQEQLPAAGGISSGDPNLQSMQSIPSLAVVDGCRWQPGQHLEHLRWKWATHHLNGQSMPYTLRRGDTLETVAFDWKVSPESLLFANSFAADVQLQAGHVITLPVPTPLY